VRLLPLPLFLSATVNDSVTGTGNDQWDYGTGWNVTSGIPSAYQNDVHFAGTTNVVAHFRFNGTQAKIYTVKGPGGGNIGYSLDGGGEQTVSNYSATQVGSLSYTSPEIAAGNHDLVIRVVGSHEPGSTSDFINVDKAEVYVP
jgi:hypothetical protein